MPTEILFLKSCSAGSMSYYIGNESKPCTPQGAPMAQNPIDLKPAYYSHMSLSYKSCSVCCIVADLSMHVASLFKYHLWYDRFALNVGLDEDGSAGKWATEIRPDSGYICALSTGRYSQDMRASIKA